MVLRRHNLVFGMSGLFAAIPTSGGLLLVKELLTGPEVVPFSFEMTALEATEESDNTISELFEIIPQNETFDPTKWDNGFHAAANSLFKVGKQLTTSSPAETRKPAPQTPSHASTTALNFRRAQPRPQSFKRIERVHLPGFEETQ